MRTQFTGEDVKNVIENIFNGNLKAYKYSNGSIEYKNPNTETIVLIDENSQKQANIDLAEYLNVEFYNWKDRLVETGDKSIVDEPTLSTFDDWVKSLNFSMDRAFALVEKIDEEVVASQEIDSSTITGKITFLIQADKIKNLDFYVTKIRNVYLGVPQSIQNSFGDTINAYIMMGALTYDQEPLTTQLGECLVVSCNFKISYMASAQTYTDTKVEISLDGDDTYDENGDIVGSTKYMTMPINKQTWQLIFGETPMPYSSRPDLTGYLANTLSVIKTFSFFDFNKTLTLRFNDLFWGAGAYRVNGKLSSVADVNVPVFIRVTSNGKSYVYKDMISQMSKDLTNSDFNISRITLKGWGKPFESVSGGVYGTTLSAR